MRPTLFLSLLILQACSTTNEPRDSVVVVWHRVADAKAACEKVAGQKEVRAVRGCSTRSDSGGPAGRLCEIYAPLPKTEEDKEAFLTLGHELMHCFEGKWHDRRG